VSVIASRDNLRVRRWRSLARDAGTRRKERSALVEGAHLVGACLESGRVIKSVILSTSGAEHPELATLAARIGKPVMLSDAVFRSISGTQTPVGIAAEIALPAEVPDLKAAASCVFLEGVQDPGNVGAILRSAAAFGISDAVLDAHCADAWSPRVLRAAMGAHFGMQIAERADLPESMDRFAGRIACAVPRGGIPIAGADLSGRIGWLFGAEGQGVSEALAARATLNVTIPMPGGGESLNVAAAAAICFHEMTRKPGA
jgi:TrmH family RNA methyltransferase